MSNIANREAVKKAELKEKDLRKQELNDIRTVLSNASGKRLLWRMLEKCRVFNSVYAESENNVYYNAGQQDFGHFIMSEIIEADKNLFMKMMKENNSKE